MEKYTTSGVVKDKSQKAIEIKFGTDNTTDDGEIDGESTCKTPMINEVQGASGSDGKCQKDYWMTHPAFLAFDATGFWVGKFETGYAGANSVTDAQAHNNATEANKIVIKPNQYSWRNISLGNAFRTSLNYETNLQSHLMKNTEWGAVAYLTHSIYGKCESSDNCTEIMINNSQNCITGMSAKNKPTTGYPAYKDYKTSTPKTNNDISWTYTDKNSVLASTSGNYSGIYDMSGGVWEETASFMYQSGNSNINYSKSGMNDNDLTDKKYYDVYNYSVLITEYNKRILGDATGELGPFGVVIKGQDIMSSMFADYANFLSNNSYLSGACFTRGGDSVNGTDAGVFAFDEYPGVNGDLVGFRVVLAPTEEKS